MPLHDQIRKGSSEIIILSLLAEEPMYGYQITAELERRCDGYFVMTEGLLYPTLHRMEKEGMVVGEWRTVRGRRRKYYRMTDLGLHALSRHSAEWRTFTDRLLHLLDSPSAQETT